MMAVAEAGDRSTPRWLFDQLDAEFHFVLDAAASRENHLFQYISQSRIMPLSKTGGHSAASG